MAKADTRTRIMDAALECFLEDGYEQATVSRIRERSGASNGALFHHFHSKEAIADALYVQAIASFQEGLWELVRKRPRSLRSAVRATIAHQLAWVEAHPELARFVYMRGHLDWDTPAGSQVAALNRELAQAFKRWMAPFVRAGEVRPTSMLMISAIVSGPAHSLAQRWLAGMLERPLGEAVDELADAAWAGLRGRPLASSRVRRVPRRGEITLELLDGEGEVLARGRASAELLDTAARRAEDFEGDHTTSGRRIASEL
jgi:AcrR family transcriptional regulator